MQLSIFIHEQAHWFVYEAEARDAGIEDLRQLYPNPPSSANYRTYQHLLVAWVTLDAMAELVGEEEARQVTEALVQKIIGEDISEIDKIYRWYNYRVLEDTQEIGAIIAKHDLIITPDKGLVVETSTK